MSPYSHDTNDTNDQMLRAWNQWKVICSVLGCDKENRALLSKTVGYYFRSHISRLVQDQIKLKGDMAENEMFAQEFDISLEIKAHGREIDGRTQKYKKPLYYKDVTWTAIDNSGDPPLKVIRGMLLKGKKTPLADIVAKYLRKNYSIDVTTHDNGYKTQVLNRSLQETIDGKDGSTVELGDLIETLTTPPELSDMDKEFLDLKIPALFTPADAAQLLAYMKKISQNAPVLLAFIGCSKTQAYDKLPTLMLKLKELLCDNFEPDMIGMACNYCLQEFYFMLEAEKSAKDFLSLVQKQLQEDTKL